MWLRVIALALFILVANLSHLVHLRQIQLLPRNQSQFDSLYLPDPAFLQVISLGHEPLLADLLWLQTIQYYGDRVSHQKPSPYLYRYFDAITTLDPDFENAYIFASYVMGEERELLPQLEKILLKGITLNPKSWILPYHLGMAYYLYFKDHAKAAQQFEKVGRMSEGQREQALRMAAQLYRRSDKLGNCRLALQLWSENIRNSSDKHLRERSERHFIETSIVCDLIRIRKALEDFKQRQLKLRQFPPAAQTLRKKPGLRPQSKTPLPLYPSSLAQLVKAGLLPALPLDFFKRPYLYDPATGTLKVQPLPWPVYDQELLPQVAVRKS